MLTTWLAVKDGSELWDLIPDAFEHLRVLYADLWDAGMDPVTLELCRLRIAALVGGAAELVAPDPRVDLDASVVDALPSWPMSPMFSDAQRAALGFAEQYALDAHGVTDEQAADLHRFWSPTQLTTLTMATAVFDALARLRAVVTTPTGHDVPIEISLL